MNAEVCPMKVDVEASFACFVYPFLFDARTFEQRVERIDNAELPGRQGPQAAWQADVFPEDNLLAHVKDSLNPLPGTVATTRVWKLNDELQGTYGLAGRAEWQLKHPGGSVVFRLGEVGSHTFAVQIILFQVGVGFLTVQARPVADDVADWFDLLHHFRFIRRQGVRLQARRRTGIDPQTREPQFAPFFPEPAGGVAEHPDGSGTLGELLDSLLGTAALPDDPSPSDAWRREVFVPGQILPFAGVYVDGAPEESAAEMLYRLRNFFHARQEICPTADDLRFDHPSLLPYAQRLWFLFSLDGGAFLACDAPETPFFRQTLPQHLRTSYFLIFLLALQQRFALMMLSEGVAKQWPWSEGRSSAGEREEAFERIRNALLSFTARGHFTQITQTAHHHRYYCQWQEAFQVARLYREVREEVGDMYDYLMMQKSERLQQMREEEQRREKAAVQAQEKRERAAQARARDLQNRLTIIAWVLGVPALALSFLQTMGVQHFWTTVAAAAGALLLSGLGYLAISYFTARGSQPNGDREGEPDAELDRTAHEVTDVTTLRRP